MHLEFVYGKECADNPDAAKFIKEQRALQMQWRKELNLTVSEAERDYLLLEWCDALSLLLCQHDNQPEARSVEISNGPEDKKYQLIQTGPNMLTVEPWPFEQNKFELYFEIRLIPKLEFKSAEEFRAAFRQAVVIEKRWVLKTRKPRKK